MNTTFLKKIFSILLVAFAMTAMVACGKKDNGTDNPTPDNPIGQTDLLPDGFYHYLYDPDDSEQGDEHILQVTNYGEYHTLILQIRHGYENDGEEMRFQGQYQYSNGTKKGSAEMQRTDDGTMSNADTAEFSYDEGNITMTFRDETVTLTRWMR